jgi:hypothetical protein
LLEGFLHFLTGPKTDKVPAEMSGDRFPKEILSEIACHDTFTRERSTHVELAGEECRSLRIYFIIGASGKTGQTRPAAKLRI